MELLKTYLADSDETQAAFAERVRTTPATISRILSGTMRPGLDLAIEIEKATDGAVPANAWRRPVPEDAAA
jgi:transcriptional regulator with XRE-family HTH domain